MTSKLKHVFMLIMLMWSVTNGIKAQDSTGAGGVINKLLSGKYLADLQAHSQRLQNCLEKANTAALNKLHRQEAKLRKQLWRKDSTKAKELFGDVDSRYANLKSETASGKYKEVYSARLDSLATSLNFLSQSGVSNSSQVRQALAQANALQTQMNVTEQIRKQIQARQELIRREFANLGIIKELKNYQKTAYYYQEQVSEYRNFLNNPDQLEQKLLSLVRQMPQFKDFFAKNSILGQLFPQPGAGTAASLAGLQTRASVNQALMQRFGSSQQLTAAMGQSVQSAQSQLSQLRERAEKFGQGSVGSNTDPEMPSFKTNNHQRTKSFLNRLEYGFNAQSQKAQWMFPATTDFGLQFGYKLNDNCAIGTGLSYKIGWGKSWNQIEITHQGLGLRSYIDSKIKGSFYISGGYEQNYRSAFKNIDALKNQNAWQASGLIGLSKKYRISSKIKGEAKLLWDFLSYQQIPKTHPIVFRIGYALK